ncbi:unnamed protein product [Mytilus edulis]|uniref:Reverse transcriptase domain-containing protein n=1 Tax=Mytilus edulis TaxID=6550 RepID=A0A8S3UIM0_MYTED|nr:unnamed protein product [Mytilus edulis]
MEFNAPSPYEAITGNDVFLDGSLPFPVTVTAVGQGTPPISSQLTDVFTSVTTKTGQQTLHAGSVGYDGGVPTTATVTHTFSRPVDTTGSISSYPGISMGLNLPGSRAPASYCGLTLPASASNAMSWSRPPWSQGYPYSGFSGQGFHGQGFPGQGFPNQVFPSQPFPGFWPYCGPTPVIVPQSTTPNLSVPAPPVAVSSRGSSISVPAALPTSSVGHQSNQVANSGPSLDGFKKNIANKSSSPVISLRPDHDIGSDLEDSDEEERFSVAPGSQEEGFTSDEDDNSVQVSQIVSQPSVPVSLSSSVIGQSSTNSGKEPETEDAPSSLKDLRDSVYTIMRDVNKVPFQSPPRPKKLTSTFEASCGLPIINDGIVSNESQFSQVSGFGLASFSEQFRSKDYEIFDSTLGKLVPKCDKVLSSTISSKPADGLRLTQSVWSKTENLLRNASHVLGTAEHFLSAVAPVLKDSSLPPEVKPFLLQKAKVSDNLKDALIKSPLDEKIFGLPLDEVQKHLNQTPVPVKVNVSVSGNNSKRGSYSSAGGSSYNSQEKRRKITNDGEQPPLSPVPIPLSNTQDPQKFLLLSTEVETLLTKRAVEEVPVSSIDPGFYSRLFLVSKKTGGMRPVIDLSILNSYMIIPHFKMETNRSIRASILPGMWTTSLDLTDAYFHVPVCHSYRKFLRFVWNKRVYQFRALPFGLSTAPLAFTKLMQVAIAHLHSQAIQIHSYLDDSLIKELSPEKLYLNTDVVIRLLLSLGFLISWKKSDLIPSQDFIFLGEHYLTHQCIVRPPQEKFQNLCSKIHLFLSQKTVTARQFSQLLGLLNSLADVVPLGRLHIRPLQFYLHQHWLPATQNWEFPVPIIHQELCPHLVWWTSQANVLRGQLLSSPVPNQTLFTDASNLGWGAYLEGLSVSGVWTPDLLKEHINILEMKAVLLALSHFQSLLQNKSLVLATDNTTVVAYLRNQGGTHCYELYLLAREILLLCNQLHLQIVVRHVPGETQCVSRCSVKNTYSSQYRVGTSTISISGNNTSVGVSPCRPVCNEPQLQNSSVHVSCTRSESLRSGLHECSLGRDVRLRFPTVQISVTSSSEDLSRARVDHSYCSSLAQTSLVSRSSSSILCSSTGSTSTTQSFVPVQGQDTSSQSREATSVRVASLRDSFKERGFSECAARHLSRAVRDSTNIVYDAKWTIFSSWCSGKEIDPFQISVQQLADFLIHLFEEKGLSPSTIKGYRSAISRTILLSGGPDFGNDEFISLLVKNFTLERPRQRVLIPSWNLSLVLSALKNHPFEPAEKVEIKFLSYKCCFLLALASGRRRSEIHAFSTADYCLRFNRDKSSRTQSLRTSSNSRLFIPINKGKQDLSVKTISSWICKTIQLAYSFSNEELLNSMHIKAHDVRAISTSWALFNNASLEEVLSAGFWRTENSFISHYLQSLATQAQSLYSLGPLVSAQRVVFPPASSGSGDSALC